MEFHVWGKLDENGKIQSVQSSCSHGNTFNFIPDQSPLETWVGESGEKYVPYSTKKELDYKLDNKIDEMSLIMVQMGELTKRLRLQEKNTSSASNRLDPDETPSYSASHLDPNCLQRCALGFEKRRSLVSNSLCPDQTPSYSASDLDPSCLHRLIAEYEEKAERQKAELKKLKLENEELRSVVFKRKRNSESSFGSFDDASITSPKLVESPMECSHNVHGQFLTEEKICLVTGVIDVGYGNDVVNVGDTRGVCENETGAPICDTRVPVQVAGPPLAVDEHGYVPLWGKSEPGKHDQVANYVHLRIGPKGFNQIPEMTCDTNAHLTPSGRTDSGLDEPDGFSNMGTLSVEFTLSEKTSCTGGHGESDTAEVGEVTLRNAAIGDGNGVGAFTQALMKNKNEPKPDYHKTKPPRYIEIPDELVSPVSSPPKCQIQSPDKDHYRKRPPMPLPNRRASDSLLSPTDPGIPYRNALSKELKNCTNDEMKDIETFDNAYRLPHRYSSPELADLGADERLSTLIRNMKTTMEWNEARKLLMSKSNTCTSEQAEESLRGIVKEAYYKCTTRITGGGKQPATVESLAQKFRNYLRRKSSYDEDILTKEFLEKCLHLLKAA